MPIYEYECPACGHAFEQLIRSQRDERKAACPDCGEPKVKRRLSVFAAHGSAPKSTPPPGGCGQCENADGGCPFQ